MTLFSKHSPSIPSITMLVLLFTLTITLTIFLTCYITKSTFRSQQVVPPNNLTTTTTTTSSSSLSLSYPHLAKLAEQARQTPQTWMNHLLHTQNGTIQTKRIGCREMDAGAQSCVFEGIACINVTTSLPFSRPQVYFIHDLENDFTQVSSDNWCSLRAQSADPRYFSSRHWPILNDTFAPQRSCLDARFRNRQILDWNRTRWIKEIWLIDLDYVNNDHNNHLVKDIIWMLDVVLWQRGMDLKKRPGYYNESEDGDNSRQGLFSAGPRWVYLPQGREDFVRQTRRDVNRLMYSLVLELNVSKLYTDFGAGEMKREPKEKVRFAKSLLEAFPELDRRLLFHRQLLEDETINLVCTPRLAVGSKIGNGGHERVCRSIRQRAWKFYGIREPEKKRLGQVFYQQPPKRIVVLQRHISRKIKNVEELLKGLESAFRKLSVEIEVVSTAQLQSAEQWVRTFSRAGVLITSHGSQSMGQMFMPRHSSLIEVMPVGYTDYSFNLLSETCKIWYYELQGMLNPDYTREKYERACGKKVPHMLSPCTELKSVDVVVNVTQAVHTIRFSMERMGYQMGDWMELVQHGY